MTVISHENKLLRTDSPDYRNADCDNETGSGPSITVALRRNRNFDDLLEFGMNFEASIRDSMDCHRRRLAGNVPFCASFA